MEHQLISQSSEEFEVAGSERKGSFNLARSRG